MVQIMQQELVKNIENNLDVFVEMTTTNFKYEIPNDIDLY